MDINNGFSKNVLDAIKEKNIKPKPRWRFLLKDYVIWGLGIAALITGGLAFSVIIYLLRNNDWDIYSRITDSIWEFVFLTLPYSWLLFLAVFIFAFYYNIKHTKKGYRYSLPLVAVVSIVSSSVLGMLFFKVGLSRAIDDVLGQKAPFYSIIFNRRPYFWRQPEKGLLAGLILSQLDENEYLLIDPEQHEWDILTEGAVIMPRFEIQIGRPVEMLGEILEKDVFRAERIMPAGPGRGFFMRHKSGEMPMQMGLPMMKGLNNSSGFRERFDDYPEILEDFPEFSQLFEKDIRENMDCAKQMAEEDPSLVDALKSFNISVDIIEQLND